VVSVAGLFRDHIRSISRDREDGFVKTRVHT
jgi:hypothetical protein